MKDYPSIQKEVPATPGDWGREWRRISGADRVAEIQEPVSAMYCRGRRHDMHYTNTSEEHILRKEPASISQSSGTGRHTLGTQCITDICSPVVKTVNGVHSWECDDAIASTLHHRYNGEYFLLCTAATVHFVAQLHVSRISDPPMQNVWEILESAAYNHGDNGILVYPPGRLREPHFTRYSDLIVKAQRNSRLLHQTLGMKPGSIVLIHFKNYMDNIEWFWSVLAAGCVPTISTPFTNNAGGRIKHILHLDHLLEHPICLTRQDHVEDFSGQEAMQPKTIESLHVAEDLECCQSPKSSQHLTSNSEELAALMLTSGSTGNCKAVCLSHPQILSCVTGKSSYWASRKGDTFMNWIALDHVAALVEVHMHAMYLGADQMHVHAPDLLQNPLLFLNLINEHRVTFSFAPNFFLAKLAQALDDFVQKKSTTTTQDQWDLSCLRTLTSGGEANVVETCRRVTQLLSTWGLAGDVINPGFGMTETCAGCISNKRCPESDLLTRREFAAVGFCIPGVEMRLTSFFRDDVLVEAKERGNLEIRGSNVFKAYYNDKVSTAAAFTQDGWFKTGDQGFVDSDGQLVLSGRTKETMIINGVKYSPHEIETTLEEEFIPGSTPGYTVAFSYRAAGFQTEQICIVYLPSYDKDNIQARVDTNDQICRTTLLQTGIRPQVLPLDASLFERSTIGKLSRLKIRLAFERGDYLAYQRLNDEIMNSYKAASYIEPCTPAEKCILEECERLFDLLKYELGATTSIFDLGVTSIDVIRLKQRLEKRMNIEDIPIITIMTNPTIQSLATALEKLNQAKAYDPVVVLQAGGSKTPLWLVHPGVGEVLIFLGLSRYLTDRPVYALRARGFDGEDFFTDISEAVQVYHKAIKQKQPQGPYAIAGYSYGTILAFELAKAMRAQDNDKIAFLGSFNLPPHIKSRMHQLDWVECLLNLSYFLGLIDDTWAQAMSPSLHQIGNREKVLDHVLQVADPNRMAELGLDRTKLAKWADLAMHLQSMAREYEPSGIVEKIDVFYATPLIALGKSKQEWLSEDLSKWAHFSANEPLFHDVEGAHYTMLGPEHVNSFQKVLKAALREAGC